MLMLTSSWLSPRKDTGSSNGYWLRIITRSLGEWLPWRGRGWQAVEVGRWLELGDVWFLQLGHEVTGVFM